MFYFFTDLDLLTNGSTYGNNGSVTMPTSYNKVGQSSNPHPQIPQLRQSAAAYAICSGKVLVDNFSGTVNSKGTLILKPDVQPANLPKIKYIIYTGILQTSLVYPFIPATSTPAVAARVQPPYNNLSATQVSPYFNNISLNVYKKNGTNLFPWSISNPTNPLSKNIIDLYSKYNAPVDVFLEECFENNNDLIQTFSVRGGDRLGIYNEDSAGSSSGYNNFPVDANIIIVLDTPHINLTLAQLREIANPTGTIPLFERYIQTSSPPPVITDMKKDLLNNFLDLAAFYGNIISSSTDRLFYRNYADSYIMQDYTINGTTTNISFPETPIFTEVKTQAATPKIQMGYDTIMAKFVNKNLSYIDIRDNEGNSYNFCNELVPDTSDPNFPNNDIFISVNSPDATNIATYQSLRYNTGMPCLLVTKDTSGNILVNGLPSTKYIAPVAGDSFSTLNIKLKSGKISNYTFKAGITTSGLQISPPQVRGNNDFANTFIPESPCRIGADMLVNETPVGMIYSTSDNVLKKDGRNFIALPDVLDGAANPKVNLPIKQNFDVRLPLVNDSGALVPIANYIRVTYLKARVPRPNFKFSCNCDPGDPYQNGVRKITDIIDFPVNRSIYNYESLDNFFQPFKMRPPVEINSTGYVGHFDVNLTFPRVVTNVYSDEYFCDNILTDAKSAYMAYQGIAVDAGGLNSGDVTLFAFSTDNLTPEVNVTDNSFRLAGGLGISTYFLNEAILKNGPTTGLVFNRKKLLQADIGTNRDYKVSFISESTPVPFKTGFLSTVKLSSFAYITIDKPTWLALVSYAHGQTAIPNVGTVAFIAPERTRLAFKLVKDGIVDAYDELNPASPTTKVHYQQLEIYLTGEVYNNLTTSPDTIVRSYPTGLYIFRCNEVTLPIENQEMPADNSVGNGYAIEQDAGIWKIKTTLLLVPGVGVTDREMYFYRQFFECNIKQIWSNIPSLISSYNRGLHEDSGNLTPSPDSSVDISSECIEVQIGTPIQLGNLANRQIGFLVCPDLSGQSRSHVLGNKRQGRMFFNRNLLPPIGGNTRYFESNPANTPAHEFGHCMFLNDRYTYIANYNTNNIISAVNGFTSYMAPAGAIDPQYIDLYNWLFNLYSTQAYTEISLASANDPNVIGDNEFITLYGKGVPNVIDQVFHLPSVVSSGCNAFVPPTNDYTTTYINPQQFNHARTNANLKREEENIDPTIFFQMRWFIFFKNTVDTGTFVGLVKNGANLNIRHDFTYSSNIDPSAEIMEQRIISNNIIDAYFSPVKTFDGTNLNEDPLGRSIGSNKKNNDVITGGVDTVKGIIDGVPRKDIEKELKKINPNITVNLSTNTIDISGNKDVYHNIGYGNSRGRLIWNKSDNTATETYGGFKIRHSNFVNRLEIRKAIMPS